MFYVSVIDGDRYALLLGPFKNCEYALARVERVKEQAIRLNDWAHFYAYGTCKADTTAPGRLNEFFPCAPYAPANRETDEYDASGARVSVGT